MRAPMVIIIIIILITFRGSFFFPLLLLTPFQGSQPMFWLICKPKHIPFPFRAASLRPSLWVCELQDTSPLLD